MNELKQLTVKLQEITDGLKRELTGLRAGRATTALVEDILVEAYGSKMPVQQLAAISLPDSRTITVEPWDKTVLGAIERAFREDASLGLSPAVKGTAIFLTIPQLTEERRRSLAKIVREKQEGARIQARRKREEAWEKIQAQEEKGEIREDDKFRAKDELQKLIDEANARIKEIGEEKEREIMEG